MPVTNQRGNTSLPAAQRAAPQSGAEALGALFGGDTSVSRMRQWLEASRNSMPKMNGPLDTEGLNPFAFDNDFGYSDDDWDRGESGVSSPARSIPFQPTFGASGGRGSASSNESDLLLQILLALFGQGASSKVGNSKAGESATLADLARMRYAKPSQPKTAGTSMLGLFGGLDSANITRTR